LIGFVVYALRPTSFLLGFEVAASPLPKIFLDNKFHLGYKWIIVKLSRGSGSAAPHKKAQGSITGRSLGFSFLEVLDLSFSPPNLKARAYIYPFKT
jgi:hypothetical protein